MRNLIVLLALPFGLSAGSLTYSASGVFDPSVPVSIFTAPNQTWAFSFKVEVNPAVTLTVDNDGFNPVFSDFAYQLNGVDQAITPTRISFWETASEGMFGIDLAANSRFSFVGPQMFSGPLSAPTMLPGVFVSTTGEFDYLMVDNVEYGSLAGTVVSVTPEPGTIAMLTAGGLALTVRSRKLRRASGQALSPSHGQGR